MGLFLRKSKSLFPVTFGDPLTTPFKEAKLGIGAENTISGGYRPDRQADFFVPRFFLPFRLSASSCRVWAEYKTLRGNHARRSTDGFQRPAPLCGVTHHRLKIDQWRFP